MRSGRATPPGEPGDLSVRRIQKSVHRHASRIAELEHELTDSAVALVAAQRLAAAELARRLTAEAERAELEGRLLDIDRYLQHRETLIAELDALHATRTFRLFARPRAAYGRVRRVLRLPT